MSRSYLRIALEDAKIPQWVGFDFDGTMATYDEWRGMNHIGEPIWPIIEIMKETLASGMGVKVFTARAGSEDFVEGKPLIEAFCEKHVGQVLEITNVKDAGMVKLYDDRAVQVETNTGEIVG